MERRRSQKSTSASRVCQSYMYSPWQARAFTTLWLERQAEQGRSKLLLPELLSLEAKLRLLVDSEAWNGMHSWLHGLLQLVQHLRWGIGTFWAPHFDTNLQPIFVSCSIYICSQFLCHPTLCTIVTLSCTSATPKALACHTRVAMARQPSTTAQFSPDGTNIVSASGDKTVRVWSVATGECVQTLEGHSGGVSSAQFSPDGTNIVSASGTRLCACGAWRQGCVCRHWRGTAMGCFLRSLARMARISYRRVTTRLCACGAWRQGSVCRHWRGTAVG